MSTRAGIRQADVGLGQSIKKKRKKEKTQLMDGYTFGKLTVGRGRAASPILSSTPRLARRFQMDPQEPASRHEKANECSSNQDSHQTEMVSRQGRRHAT